MSNNKKIVSILFSVVVLLSNVQVSALTLSQLNPISWNIRGKLSALNIGFPQFLKDWRADKKPVEIELPEALFSQETVEEKPRQGFFSKLFSRPRFRMPIFAFKKTKKEIPYVLSTFPKVKIVEFNQVEQRECATQTDQLNNNIETQTDLDNETQDSEVQAVQLNNDAETQTDFPSLSPYDFNQGALNCLSLGMLRNGKGNGTPQKRNPNGDKIPFPGYGQN